MVKVIPMAVAETHFIINSQTGDVLMFNGRMHRKIKGRAYRSYWLCLTDGCSGKIMLNDLKGGSISEIDAHHQHCQMDAINKFLK